MFRTLRLILASMMIATFASATSAGDGSAWSIVQASGRILIQTSGAKAVSLGDTRTIFPGTTLATGANARALLQRGEETMIVGPNTIMQLPPDSSRLFTTVIEVMGVVEVDVEKRNVKHFAVETPNLAAVVKGTHFAVRAGANGDSVAVTRGVVEVEALRTGKKVDVLPGQRAELSGDSLVVFEGNRRADAGSGAVDTASVEDLGAASAGIGGGDGISASVGGSEGVSASAGDGDGISASVGGSNGVNASIGGGNGVSASVGGSNGVGVSAGGGSGVSVHVGGIGLGLGGH